MKHITSAEIKQWERFYRANFINCLSGFKSVTLIGTIKENGQPNLGVFSNVFHAGADPAVIGFVNRPKVAAPHTIANIERAGSYTMNLVPDHYIANAHQSSAKYSVETDEFAATGFTMEFIEGVKAPFVTEGKVKYALELLEVIPIQYNGTFIVLGNVTDVLVDEDMVSNDGFIHLEKAGTVTSLGMDAYYSTKFLGRYKYAREGETPTRIY